MMSKEIGIILKELSQSYFVKNTTRRVFWVIFDSKWVRANATGEPSLLKYKDIKDSDEESRNI